MEALQEEEIHLDDEEVEEGELPERRGMLMTWFYCVIA